ncbi:baculoviral IAP repeat-containing protein 7-B-like [Lissotriton helveticus]
MSYYEKRRLSLPRDGLHGSSSSDSLAQQTVDSVLNNLVPGWDASDCRRASMSSEEDRLWTFQNWPPSAPVSPLDLARSGFFYLGPDDRVQCFSCRGILKCWAAGESAMSEHRKFFPDCPFVLEREVCNRPRAQPRRRCPDCTDGQIMGHLQNMYTQDSPAMDHPAHPDMVREWARLASFRYWPLHAVVQPQKLAEAGFFYVGHGDHVKCFYCDGGLRNWEVDDDPLIQHAKWFPRCEFVQHVLGESYIAGVQYRYFGTQENQQVVQETETSPAQHRVLETSEQAMQTRQTPTRQTPAKDEETPEEQLHRLQEERMCKVCMDNQVSIVFVPCGHLVVCLECAPSLAECPICRTPIRGTVRTFMS